MAMYVLLPVLMAINFRNKFMVITCDPYLNYNSIKNTTVCGHLDLNCLKLNVNTDSAGSNRQLSHRK